jgi:hypothetical protein
MVSLSPQTAGTDRVAGGSARRAQPRSRYARPRVHVTREDLVALLVALAVVVLLVGGVLINLGLT